MVDFFRRRPRPTYDPARVPPGQAVTEKWPVLHYGSVPRPNLDRWRFRVFGLVEEPVEWTWADFQALPRVQRRNDIHCVTAWSKLDNTWDGVAVRDVLARVRRQPGADYVMVHGANNYTTNLSLADFDRDENLFADHHDGEPLTPDHGAPLRLVVPHLYFWKSAKWVTGLEFMAADRPGFWENYGYHRHGDPWTEERYG